MLFASSSSSTTTMFSILITLSTILIIINNFQTTQVLSSSVVTLTDENFHELTSTGTWILDFYAPWCGHCQKLDPILEQVATQVDDKIRIGKIDCTVQTALKDEFGVKSFPTLKYLRDGDYRPYRGERTYEGFISFVHAFTSNSVAKLKRKEISNILKQHPVIFVFFGKQNAPEMKIFERVARRYQTIVGFYQSSNQILAKEYATNIDQPSVVVINDAALYPVFKGPWDEKSLRLFVDENQFPLVSELTGNNFHEITGTGKLVVMCVTDPEKQSTLRYLEALRFIARSYRDKYVFANINGIKFDKYVSQFGLSPEYYPVMFILDYPNELFYPPPDGFRVNTANNIATFLDSVYDGKITARTIGPWWSPARFFKWVEKFLTQYSDTELMIGTLVICMLMMACCFWLFCTGDTRIDDNFDDEYGSSSSSSSKKDSSSSSSGGSSSSSNKNNKVKTKDDNKTLNNDMRRRKTSKIEEDDSESDSSDDNQNK